MQQDKNLSYKNTLFIYTTTIIFIAVTFTQLRFKDLFGIGEILLLILFFYIIGKVISSSIINYKYRIFSKFWFYYLIALSLGYAVNHFLEISKTSIIFDVFSYLLVFILCFAYESILMNFDKLILEKLLKRIFVIGTLVMFSLYLYSKLISHSFFEFSLYYGDLYFAPLAKDPHQFIYFILPLPFAAGYFLFKERSIFKKVIYVILIVILILMGIANDSETLFVAWPVGVSILVLYALFIILKLTAHSNLFSVILIVLVLLISILCLILLNNNIITEFIDRYTVQSEAGIFRVVIWKNAVEAWTHSPIFGLGPGSFSGKTPFAGYEAHNTFLQILDQAGVVGGVLYLIMIFKLLSRVKVNIFLLAATVSLIVYGFGINDLRRLALWFFYIIFYFLATKIKDENNVQDEHNNTGI